MKFQLILAAFAALAAAAPTPVAIESEVGLEKRQLVGTTANEYTEKGCRPIIFIYARGTIETGNLGLIAGPGTANGLKAAFGLTNVAAEGIDYPALVTTNLLPGGADLNGIAEMKALLNDAASKCPNSILVVGGYSQGAAMTHRAVEYISDSVKAKIAAIVTFGDTQNAQDGGRIPNFPKEKTLIICNVGDAVCSGTLLIFPAHLDYTRRVPEAVAFLVAKIKATGYS
ncbi:Cutinase [Dactylella cylindrospora]|nr:Cutinase [Dactylella cylindrospora]